jgi:hypothetical protein
MTLKDQIRQEATDPAELFDFLSEHKVERAEIEFEGEYYEQDEDLWKFTSRITKVSVHGKANIDIDGALSDAADLFLDDDWAESVEFLRDRDEEFQTANGTILLDVPARTVRIKGTAKVFPLKELVEKNIDESWEI